MVSVADPRNSGACGEEDGNVCDDTEGKHGGVLHAAVFEDHHNLQDKPGNTGYRTAGVNSSQVLRTQSDACLGPP